MATTAKPPMALGRLPRQAVETLLAAAVRFQPVQYACLNQIKPEHFRPDEMDLRLFWVALQQVALKSGGTLPDGDKAFAAFSMELNTIVTTYAATPEMRERLLGDNGLLYWVYAWEAESFDELAVQSYLKQFIVERNNDLILAIASEGSRGAADPERQDKIRTLLDASDAGLVTEDKVFQPAMPTAIDIANLGTRYKRVMTDIRWLDKRMNGQGPAEVYTVLGPSGVGKTTLGIMLACNGVDAQAGLVNRGEIEKAGIWYIATWETTRSALSWRLLAYAAKVDAKRLGNAFRANDMSLLNQPGQPYSTYEKSLMDKLGYTPDYFLSEVERIERARKQYENGLHVIDCSGAIPGLGFGGPKEIGAYIYNRVKRGIPCAGVVIDWAGQAVSMQLQAERREVGKNIAAELMMFVPQCLRYIAIPCNCPVWVFHQLVGRNQNASPTTRQTAANAAWCTMFSFNAWYGFAMGTRDRANNACCIWADKTRDSEPDDSGTILKIEGHVAMLRDASDEYEFDPSTGQFVQRTLAERIIDPRTMGEKRRKGQRDKGLTSDNTVPGMDPREDLGDVNS